MPEAKQEQTDAATLRALCGRHGRYSEAFHECPECVLDRAEHPHGVFTTADEVCARLLNEIRADNDRLARCSHCGCAAPQMRDGSCALAACPHRAPRADTNPKSAFGMKKPPLHLVPESGVIETAVVFGLGARKYGPYNWRESAVAASVYVSAAKRHLAAWFDGESTDEESGASHLAHAAACMFILLDAMAIDKLVDDRPLPGAAGRRIRELTAK